VGGMEILRVKGESDTRGPCRLCRGRELVVCQECRGLGMKRRTSEDDFWERYGKSKQRREAASLVQKVLCLRSNKCGREFVEQRLTKSKLATQLFTCEACTGHGQKPCWGCVSQRDLPRAMDSLRPLDVSLRQMTAREDDATKLTVDGLDREGRGFHTTFFRDAIDWEPEWQPCRNQEDLGRVELGWEWVEAAKKRRAKEREDRAALFTGPDGWQRKKKPGKKPRQSSGEWLKASFLDPAGPVQQLVRLPGAVLTSLWLLPPFPAFGPPVAGDVTHPAWGTRKSASVYQVASSAKGDDKDG